MKLTEKLDLLMEEKGIKRADLSRETGIPYSTLSSLYDKGYENVKLTTLRKLAEYFECSLDYIADDAVVEKWPVVGGKELKGEYRVTEDIAEYIPRGIKLFPIVGIVRAGQPILAQENIEGYFPIDNSFIAKDKEYFFLKVKGDRLTGCYDSVTLYLYLGRIEI
jgi:SOS-response transcriptional repressor LexA